MDAARKEATSAQEYLILGVLAVVAAASWAWLAWRRHDADMSMTADIGRSAAPFMLAWAVMMAAMMLPTAAPMVLTFHKVQSHTKGPGRFLRTWMFVAGYMLLWTLTGVAAYAAKKRRRSSPRPPAPAHASAAPYSWRRASTSLRRSRTSASRHVERP
jgi:predicted metal-binding membrane protein